MPLVRPLKTHVIIRTISSFCNSFHFASLPSSASPFAESGPLCSKNPFRAFASFTLRSGDDTFAWNLAIRRLLDARNPKGAVLEYALMRREGVVADSHTVGFAVKGCCSLLGVREGRQVHCHVLKMGFDSEVVVQTALLRMYGLFGELLLARRVFDETCQRDLPMWNAILTAYAQRGCPEEVMHVAHAMGDEGVRPNEVTAMSIVSGCSSLGDLRSCRVAHGYIVKNVLCMDTRLFSALINMYAKCRCLQSARCLFDTMQSRDVVSWTTMISGYSDNNCPQEALALFEEMVAANVLPDEITMLGVASMCGKLERIELARLVDKDVQEKGFCESTRIANALMLMHAKCGNIKRACQIFDQMKVRTVVSWTTIIQGLAIHGYGVEALVRFTQMQRAGYIPDEICFLGILSACNHSGLVEEGKQCFRSMIEEHKMTPWIEHYGSMVDLLCRAGLVNETFGFLESMPVKPDARMQRAFIGACKDQGNLCLAERAMDHLFGWEPELVAMLNEKEDQMKEHLP